MNWSRLRPYNNGTNIYSLDNLVTSVDFFRIRGATTLCHFGQTQVGYLATHSILLSSTAESSATSGYVVVQERFGQNEEPAGNNKERASKEPSLVPEMDLIDAIVFLSM